MRTVDENFICGTPRDATRSPFLLLHYLYNNINLLALLVFEVLILRTDILIFRYVVNA